MGLLSYPESWLIWLVTRLKFGKEAAEATSESYEQVMEETGGLGGSIVNWAREKVRNIIIFIVAIVVILLILYVIIRKFLNK